MSRWILVTSALLGACSDMDSYTSGAAGAGSQSYDSALPEAGQLTAAEWSDLDNWDFWQELVWTEGGALFEAPTGWGREDLRRVSVDVRHGSAPVVDAVVELFDAERDLLWTARSDIQGRAELFAGVDASEGPYFVRATTRDGTGLLREVDTPEDVATELQLVLTDDGERPVLSEALDLMFVVDTTGSMGDELSWLQAELLDVLDRVSAAAPNVRVRVSVNVYRDEGDSYVVRPNPFTDDPEEAVDALRRQRAGGGGDTPEALDAALRDGVLDHDWREEADARLLFLVADAPPHAGEAANATLDEVITAATERGVRLIPVGASGVDRDTELLLRTLAVETGGTYVFLTDDSGIGADHLEPIVGEVQVELLNDLLVRVISEEIGVGLE